MDYLLLLMLLLRYKMIHISILHHVWQEKGIFHFIYIYVTIAFVFMLFFYLLAFFFLQSVPKSVIDIFLQATHRYYLRNIYANLKKKGHHGLELKIGFWCVSKSYTNLNYYNYMRDTRDVDIGALNWLKNIPLKI